MEVELREAMEEARWEVGHKLRPRKRNIDEDSALPRL